MLSVRKRLLVIALGEATFDIILPLIEKGELPVLKQFFHEGSTGNLKSIIPMITPQIWGTIITGKNPGNHGLFDFWQRGNDGKFREVNGSGIKAEPVWKILSRHGITSGVVNVPFTYPPQDIQGFMISGEDAPGAHPSIASPRELYREITGKFGRYRLKDIFPGGRKKEDYLTLVDEDVRKQTDVLEYLISNKKWDFFLTFYSAAAITQHYFWKDMVLQDNEYRDIIKNAYKSLDAAVGRLVKAAGPETNVFIISECGAGPLISGISINTWLRQEGFLVYKNQKHISNGNGRKFPKKNFPRSAVAGFRKNVQGMIPKSLFYFANKNVHWLKNWIKSYLEGSDINWDRTYAFSRGKEGDIFINMKGRDPRGIVDEKDYGTVRNHIIEKLSLLRNPSTGALVVNKVFKREEIYNGPYLEFAPDLLIDWVDSAYMPAENDTDKDSVFVERWRENMNWPTSGSHRIEGILLAKGPGIEKNRKVEDCSIIDMTPTWLSLLNLDIQESFEGKIISDLIKNEKVLS